MGNILTNPLFLGPIVTLLVQGLKALPIPFEGKTRTGILAALTLITIVVEVAAAVLSGQVERLDFATLLPRLIEAATTLLAAAGAYSLVKRVTEAK